MKPLSGPDTNVEGSKLDAGAWTRQELDAAYDALTWGEEPFITQDADLTLAEYAALLDAAQRWAQAARRLVSELKTGMLRQLDNGEAYRYGDTAYRHSIRRRRRLADPIGFAHWCGPDIVRAVNLASGVRLTQVREIAGEKGVNVSTVFDTFFDDELGVEELSILPLARAPQWVQRLDDGERSSR